MSDFSIKYRILEKIGEGSFSDVLKCESRNSCNKYAAKRLKRLFDNVEEVMQCAEIIAMQKLRRHPNVLYMFEFYYNRSTKQVVFIFELMDISMYELIIQRKRPFSENKCKNYLYQLLKGLDHLHTNGLFHRDIKPENILLKLSTHDSTFVYTEDAVKLADLGSIRGIYSRKPYTEYVSTRWYRSPECLLTNGYYGPKMDVWSAGCVFYEMITTKPLFPGLDEIDQLDKIHTVLGTPNGNTFMKFRKHKSKNYVHFAHKSGIGMDPMGIPLSKEGQNILKLMIKYDPGLRSNVKRVLEHPYFHSLREKDLENKYQPSYSEIFNRNSGDSNNSNSMYQTKPPIALQEFKRSNNSSTASIGVGNLQKKTYSRSSCSFAGSNGKKSANADCKAIRNDPPKPQKFAVFGDSENGNSRSKFLRSSGANKYPKRTRKVTGQDSKLQLKSTKGVNCCCGNEGSDLKRLSGSSIQKRKLSRESNSCSKQIRNNIAFDMREELLSNFSRKFTAKGLEESSKKAKTSSLLLPRQILGMTNSVTITDFKLNAIVLNSCKINLPSRNK